MAQFRSLASKFSALFRRRELGQRIDEEIQFHLQMQTEENIRRGMDLPDAEAAARRKIGNITYVTEEAYRMNTLSFLEEIVRNVRFSLRALRRSPAFAAAAILTLAIGIGANTAVFSIVNGILLKPLPYPEAGRLISVQHAAPGAPGMMSASGDLRLSASMFFTYVDNNRSFEAIGAWTARTATVTGQGEPEEVRTIVVTKGVLEALGVKPAVGRWLSEADQSPGAARAVMLSYGYWQRRFGGDQTVIGKTLVVSSQPAQIVGVMPAGFGVVDTEAELIMPFQFNRAELFLPGFFLRSVARLKPGVTLEAAHADIARMVPVWMSSWPAPAGVNPRDWEQWRITPTLRPLRQDVVGRIEQGLWVVMGTMGIVMLIACANVTNLLLVRAEARQRELAVRAALGAGWGRIVRQLLAESLTLGLFGGLLGTAIAAALLKAVVAIGPASLPRLNEINMDWRTAFFALGVSLTAGLLLGLIPAWQYARPKPGPALQAGGRSATDSRQKHKAQDALVAAQVALALVLLVCSGLMIRTFQALNRVQPGFTGPEQIQTLRIAIPPALITEPERVALTHQQIQEKLATLPGVSSVGFASTIPTDGQPPNWDGIGVEGRPLPPNQFPPMRRFKDISPGFLESMGTRLIVGRSYEWADLLDRRPVILISENLAREYWGDPGAALGKRIVYGRNFREVIGVVQDVYDNGVRDAAPATVYWPTFGANSFTPVTRYVTFTLRSARTGSEEFLREVEQAVWSVNSNLSVAAAQSMAELHDRSMARTSFTLVMLAIAGGMALMLGVVGIYGVISYTVAQRRREVGIRLALGAAPRAVSRMFLRRGMILCGAGCVLGLGGALVLSSLMKSLLFGVTPLDPMTYAVMPIVLLAPALAACYFPAKRAAAVDPVETLRAE
ncbi:MAG TPA: ABC transporter permease [Blastocatellia bacterium]|nr:ABC transporter permease [Blastocatellia bacterium]